MLDFSKETDVERLGVVQTELRSKSAKLSPKVLSTYADYILWGKSTAQSQTPQTSQTFWDTSPMVLSLCDAEDLAGLAEASFRPISSPPTLIRRKKFDREAALKLNPQLFGNLFREIDRLDLAINFWEIEHGRRTLPPRESLLHKFTEEEQREIAQQSATWTQQQWLRQRHLLVEKRREQYTLFYAHAHSEIAPHTAILEPIEDVSVTLGTEIPVFPLGLKQDSPFLFSIFEGVSFADLQPIKKSVSDFYWTQKAMQEAQRPDSPHFDFGNPAHLAKLVGVYADIHADHDPSKLFDRTLALADTFDFYFEHTEMPPQQRVVLLGKLAGKSNAEIRQEVNSTFGTTYHINYISTLFTKRALPKIAETAKLHQRIAGELFFPENFKPCSACGRWLLRSSDFFFKRSRASDGFENRCKRCAKGGTKNGI